MSSDLEKRIAKIEQRNRRVELDKAWETSWQRKILVLIVTYVVVVFYFLFIGVDQPYLNATVPTLGFYLSTITISLAKEIWIKRQ